MLCACSSSSGGDPTSSSSPLAGAWTGHAERPIGELPVLGLVTPDGVMRLTFVSSDFTLAYPGLMLDWIDPRVNEEPIGQMNWLLQPGGDWMPLDYVGSFEPGESMTLTFVDDSRWSSLTLRPRTPSAGTVDPATIPGLWRSSGTPAVEWQIDTDGRFTGSDESGCTFAGEARIDGDSDVLALSGTVNCGNGPSPFVGSAGLFLDAEESEALVIALHWALVTGQDYRVDILRRAQQESESQAWGTLGWLYAVHPDGTVELRGELVSPDERAR